MARNYIVLDTETAPAAKGMLHPENSLVYDLGYKIVDGNTEETIARRSMVITETFFNPDLMNSAYYANKLPQYHEGLGTEWEPVSFLEAFNRFQNDVKAYGIKSVWAFNAKFDEGTLNATAKRYSNGFVKFFLPVGCKFHDIWDYAGSTICNTKKYVKWCIENEYLTATGNPKTSAEIVYRYITGNHDFDERHTALDDCEIEHAILTACKRRHAKARHSKGYGWKDAAAIKKNM